MNCNKSPETLKPIKNTELKHKSHLPTFRGSKLPLQKLWMSLFLDHFE